MDIVYLNDKINTQKDKFYKFFSFPVYKIKLSITYKQLNSINIFEKAIISLLLANFFTSEEIAKKIHLREELVQVIMKNLLENNYINTNNVVTDIGKKYFFEEDTIENFKIAYAFYDINNNRFLKKLLLEEGSLLHNDARKDNDEYVFVHKTESNNETIRFTNYSVNNKESNISHQVLEKRLEKFLYNMKKNSNNEIISSHFLIGKPVKTNILTKLVGKYDVKEGSCKHSINVEMPLSKKNDTELLNSIYNNLSENVMMKKLLDEINNDIFEYRFSSDKKHFSKNRDRIISQMFTTYIAPEHIEYVASLQEIINMISSANLENNDDNKSEKRLALKRCLVALADVFEMLLYNSFRRLDFIPEGFSNNRNSNKVYLSNIILDLGVEFINPNIFNISNTKIDNIFTSNEDKVIDDMIISTIILYDKYNGYCLKNYIRKNPNFLNDLYIFGKQYRNESRHDIDNAEVSARELNKYLNILFDLFKEIHGYEYNMQFRSEILSYNYTELPLYTNKVFEILGKEIAERNNRQVVFLREHIINSYLYYKSNNSTYLLTLKPIVDTMLKNIVNHIICKLKIKPYLNFSNYSINVVEDFIEVVESLGFEVQLNTIFDSKLEKSLHLNKKSDDYLFKGMQTEFKKSNNRPVLQSLILILKNNDKALDFFIHNGSLYKEFFIIISSFMYVTSSHNQKNYEFNQEEADYLINNVFDLISRFKFIL